MDAIILDNFGSKLEVTSNSLAIRTAVLCAADILLAGDAPGLMIHYEEQSRSTNLEVRMRLLINAYSKKEDQNLLSEIKGYQKTHFELKKIKHKPTAALTLQKRLEKVVNALFEDYMQVQIDFYNKIGTAQLLPLAQKEIFKYDLIYHEDPENPPDSKRHSKASEILQYATELISEPPEETKKLEKGQIAKKDNSMFILPFDFFNTHQWLPNQTILGINEPNAANEDTIVAHQIFTLPNINSLSGIELEGIRNQVKPIYEKWNILCDQFIMKCKHQEPDAFTYLTQTVIPAAADIQQAYEQNQQLQNIITISHEPAVLGVCIGLMPIASFLTLYEHYKIIKPATVHSFNDILTEKNHQNMRIPFLAIKNLTTAHNLRTQTTLPEQIKAVKKSLNID